jgi:digeranylgeranylglycerophospholipid reductase
MLEKRQEIGSPVRCAEGVGQEQLTHFIDPEPRWIAAQVNSARIMAIRGGQQQEFSATGGLGYVLERRVFDRALAERAALAGADVRVKTAATGLLFADGAVHGVKVAAALPGVESAVEAAVVIGADGVEAQTARWSGLATALPLADTMVCAQYLLAGIDIDPTCTCYTIDWATAPGGYAWVFPKGERSANVGLGVQADLCDAPPAADSAGQPTHPDVLGRLIQFIEADRRLAAGSPVTLVLGNVPVAAGIKRKVASGLILVGDAARQVDPLTGGGITNAMAAGQLAAEVAVEASAAGDTSGRFLHLYEERWQASIGRKMARNYRLRQRFPPEQRADERFVQAFALAVGG